MPRAIVEHVFDEYDLPACALTRECTDNGSLAGKSRIWHETGSLMQEAVRVMNPGAEFHTPEGCYVNELSNTDADPDASIARARVRAGGTTRWHRLRGIAERYVVLSGTGTVEVGELPPRKVGAGDVVLIPPGCRQRITSGVDEDLVFLAICTPRFRQEAYEDIDPAPMPPRAATAPGST
jgi:mannose-6-phosphate isomerase-like protein (cupin superfamily)